MRERNFILTERENRRVRLEKYQEIKIIKNLHIMKKNRQKVREGERERM